MNKLILPATIVALMSISGQQAMAATATCTIYNQTNQGGTGVSATTKCDGEDSDCRSETVKGLAWTGADNANAKSSSLEISGTREEVEGTMKMYDGYAGGGSSTYEFSRYTEFDSGDSGTKTSAAPYNETTSSFRCIVDASPN